MLDVRRRGIDQEAQGHNREAVRHVFLQEPGLLAGERPVRRAQSVEGPPARGEGDPYLFVDARYEKVRTNRRVVSQGVLVVSGVREDGMREILALEVGEIVSEATYRELFWSLKRRGL